MYYVPFFVVSVVALPYHFGRPFGQGSGHIWVDNLNCNGAENSMWECPYDLPSSDSHSEDSGLQCFDTTSELQLITSLLLSSCLRSTGYLA